MLIIPFFENGDDVGGVKEAEKTTEEALEKHPSQECLSDFSAPHYNEVKVQVCSFRFIAHMFRDVC